MPMAVKDVLAQIFRGFDPSPAANATNFEALRNLAASSQEVLEDIVLEYLLYVLRSPTLGLEPDHRQTTQIDGLVVTGGCALNVKANSRIKEELGLPVYVPSAPNDGGLTAGFVWSVQPPCKVGQHHLTYLGAPLWDRSMLGTYMHSRRKHSAPSLPELASLFVEGANIIAVIRGRQEFGPRALGHRSLLAYPSTNSVKDRLNQIKFREWYRPVAPVMLARNAEFFFGKSSGQVESPWMSFAPALTLDAMRAFPAIAHLDGSARVQTVGEHQDPWLHELLEAIAALTGFGVLANTSFNVKGRPIINRLAHAFEVLDETPELSFLLVEDHLFERSYQS